jgi:hypothetical protein
MVELLEMHRTTACSHDFFHHQSLLKRSLHPVTSLVLWSVAHLVSVGVQCNFRERIAFYKWWRSQTKQYKIIREVLTNIGFSRRWKVQKKATNYTATSRPSQDPHWWLQQAPGMWVVDCAALEITDRSSKKFKTFWRYQTEERKNIC